MRFIRRIFVHCTAGHTNSKATQAYFFRPKKAGGRGWKIGGYNKFVDYDGSIEILYPLEVPTNGVLGFNSDSFHIVYRGGVLKTDVKVAQDTRTDEQKEGIIRAIMETLDELREHQDVSEIEILGHRDVSPDQNKNGIIEPWERIKECPSFEAKKEYAWIKK